MAKKKRATRAETREMLHLLTVLASEILDKTVHAACVVRVNNDTYMTLVDVLDVREKANKLCNVAHEVAHKIDPEPPFPNPHDRKNYGRRK
jgi:tetrahydromethanopterin S-methyltransferase subunit B